MRRKTLFLTLITILCLGTSITSTLAKTEKPTLNILFIGNSYVFYNDLPGMLQKLINANPESPVKANIQSVTRGGADLRDHWLWGQALRTIKTREDWHYIILQNQSNWAMHEDFRRQASVHARKFAAKIDKTPAVPLVFTTWPKEPGSNHYTEFPYLQSYAKSHAALNHYSRKLAAEIGGQTVPVNDYWTLALKQAPTLKLYTDGSHPTPAGSYLAALVFHKTLIGKPVNNMKLVPAGIDRETGRMLQYLIAQNPAPKIQNKQRP